MNVVHALVTLWGRLEFGPVSGRDFSLVGAFIVLVPFSVWNWGLPWWRERRYQRQCVRR